MNYVLLIVELQKYLQYLKKQQFFRDYKEFYFSYFFQFKIT